MSNKIGSGAVDVKVGDTVIIVEDVVLKHR